MLKQLSHSGNFEGIILLIILLHCVYVFVLFLFFFFFFHYYFNQPERDVNHGNPEYDTILNTFITCSSQIHSFLLFN